jgi:hypothetical protein
MMATSVLINGEWGWPRSLKRSNLGPLLSLEDREPSEASSTYQPPDRRGHGHGGLAGRNELGPSRRLWRTRLSARPSRRPTIPVSGLGFPWGRADVNASNSAFAGH